MADEPEKVPGRVLYVMDEASDVESVSGVILGRNERSLPNEFGEPINYKVVLVSGSIKDYAAYVGRGSLEWIARHGDKLSFEEANLHFCGALSRERYRE